MGEHKFNPLVGAVREALSRVKDQYGRDLQVGDVCLLTGMMAPAFRIVNIAPALEPGVPPGALKVTFSSQVILLAPAGVPQQNVARVLTVAEQRPADAPPEPPTIVEAP